MAAHDHVHVELEVLELVRVKEVETPLLALDRLD
jgi:hypothetical protein